MKFGIIFDMDGVLIDSGEAIIQSFIKFLGEFGIRKSHDEVKGALGRTLEDQIQLWNYEHPDKQINISPEEFSTKCAAYEMKILGGKLSPDPVVLETIDSIKEMGYGVAVATSSTKDRAETYLKKIGVFEKLDAFVTCEDVQRGKPNPDMFLEAAKRIDVEPVNCMAIEDAVSGIKAANSAGMVSTAMITAIHTEADFEEADYIAENFIDLRYLCYFE